MKSKFKPLLFTTTVRNPARFKRYLYVLNKFEGKILTETLAKQICGEAMRYGIYRPNNRKSSIAEKWPHLSIGDFGEALLTDAEVEWLLDNNPQDHKEAGFAYGWPSRFATIFGAVRQFGFAYFALGEKIVVSKIGKRLVGNLKVQSVDGMLKVEDDNPQNDMSAFLHAMVKYHRDNPFLRVLNSNTPIVLLLQVIKLLNADKRNNGCGISRRELPILIFWKDNDANAAYEMIMEIRQKWKYAPSAEIIWSYCVDKIMGGEFKKFKLESLVNEYPDEYIRKMRYTGLISLRGGGRFIDINSNESAKVEYILKNYSAYKTYDSEQEYYEYVSTVDDELLGIEAEKIDASQSEKLLKNWTEHYEWKQVKQELMVLSKHKSSSDSVLKFLDAPVRLEFLAALAVKMKRPMYRVCPNYTCDDEGLPTSTAGGNQGDIECYGENNFIVEVTMAEGRAQVVMEGWPIKRHLEAFSKKNEKASCMFVSPTIYPDTRDQFEWTFDKKNLYTVPFTICDFITELDKDVDELAQVPTVADALS